MEQEILSSVKRRKFGTGYYYEFCDDSLVIDDILRRVRNELDKMIHRQRYDFGLNCSFSYNEDGKLNQISAILDGEDLKQDKLAKVYEVLKRDDSNVFSLTNYSYKLEILNSIMKINEGIVKFYFDNYKARQKARPNKECVCIKKDNEKKPIVKIEREYVPSKENAEVVKPSLKAMSNGNMSGFGM